MPPISPVRSLSLIFVFLAAQCAEAQTVLLDNSWIHAVRVNLAPHEHLLPHEAPATVVINLNTREPQYRPAGTYTETNGSDSPTEEILVELKPNAPPLPRHAITLDPVKLDPHHAVIFENDSVRLIRNTLEPGIKGPMHEHTSYLVVYLTDLHTTVTQGDGKLTDNSHKRGEVTWRDYTKHAVENIGSRLSYEIQIELK